MKTPEEVFFESEILNHYEYLKKYLRLALSDKSLVEDVLQETMVRAWEKVHILQAYKDVRAALRVMAINLHLNHRSAKKNQEFLLEEGLMEKKLYTEKDNLLLVLAEENRRIVLEAIGNLKKTKRNIILLKYYYDLSFKEISALLDINYNTVLSHHRRAIMELKKILKR